MKFQGIVLAGGKSSRFGEDKALALIDGIPMIQRAVNLLREFQFDPCIITNGLRDYSFLKCRIERDLVSNKGPLGGIYTASRLFKGSALLILACDMPFLTVPVLATLAENHRKPQQATVFCDTRNKRQPFPGFYESDLLDLLWEEIQAERLSIEEFLNRVPCLKVIKGPSDQELFANINEKKASLFLKKKQG